MSTSTSLQTLQEEYENLPNFQETLLTLEFSALCPDGRIIPVDKLCEDYQKKPDGLVLRTLEDRLVIVLQAKFPGQETPYWQQAFYLSTGMNSGMPKTWLPFDGILLKGLLFRPPPPYIQTQADRDFMARMQALFKASSAKPAPAPSPAPAPTLSARDLMFGHSMHTLPLSLGQSSLPKPMRAVGKKPERPELTGSPWFSKNDFHNYSKNSYYRENTEVNTTNINVLLREVYGGIFLPEGDMYKNKYYFERFGTISYALASHALGGDFFNGAAGNSFFYQTTLSSVEGALKAHFNTVSAFQPCWLDIQSNYPIEKPYVINKYIEDHKAFSFMNAFRQENIFPPGLSFVQMPIKTLGYSMPFYDYQLALVSEINNIWRAYKKGEKTLDEVRDIFSKPRNYAEPILKRMRKTYAYADEPEYVFNIVESQADPSHPIRKYLGGRKTRRSYRRSRGNRKTKGTRRRSPY